MGSTSDHSSTKSTESGKRKLSKKLSNTKIINGICNTAFTLEEKLQSKGYSNLRNSDDAKSSDEDAANSTAHSTVHSPDLEPEHAARPKDDASRCLDNECTSCKSPATFRNVDGNESDRYDKDCDICYADKPPKDRRKNSDIRAAVQNLACGINLLRDSSANSPAGKCDKCTSLPDYVQQLSTSSSDHKGQNGRANGLSRPLNCSTCCLQNGTSARLDEHNVEMPDTSTGGRSKILSALKGVLLAFLSSIFFSLTTVIVKYVKEVDAGQMAIYRFTGMLLFVFPVVTDSGKKIFGPRHLRHWILLRGLAGASSLYLRYSTLHYLPISNATVIVLSMPVFVCIFGRIFLKEACGVFHVIALGVTLVGIAFTSKLTAIFGSDEEAKKQNIDRQHELYGLISGLGATLVGSSAYILVRKVKDLHYSVILFNFAWVALLESFVITYTVHEGIKIPTDNVTPWLLMALGILSFYGQMLLTRALQAEEAALVSVTRSASEVFFAFLFQIIIFRNMPTVSSIIGAALVTSAVMLTSVRKYVIDLPEDNLARRIFWFTLK